MGGARRVAAGRRGRLFLLGVSCAAAGLGAGASAAGAFGRFAPHVDYLIAGPPYGTTWDVASADFNQDGYKDVAVCDSGAKVSIFLANSDGTLRPAVGYPLVSGAQDMTVADFDNDGDHDIATSEFGPGPVSVLLGKGDGTFGAPAAYPVPAYATDLESGDLDKDGHPDLVVSHNISNADFTVLLGKGDGTFKDERHDRLTNPANPSSVAVADFDRDGKLDLLLDGNDLVRGNGDGTFRLSNVKVVDPGRGGPPSLVRDFNRDGKLDVLVSESSRSKLALFRGRGDGTFRSPIRSQLAHEARRADTADFDRDGQLDLVIIDGRSGSGAQVVTLRGHSKGAFDSPTDWATQYSALGVATGDLNNDAGPDIIAIDDSVSVLLNQP